MKKEIIKKIVDECNSKIKINLEEISKIKSIDYYTEEYKKSKIDPMLEEIKNLKIQAKNEMQDSFNNEINEIKNKEIFKFGDVETSNILKMLEMGISSMQKDEIQYLVNKYSDNPVIYRALQSQINKYNIIDINMPFKIFMPNTEKLEEKRDSLCNGMNMESDSLFTSLSLDMIMANDDTEI